MGDAEQPADEEDETQAGPGRNASKEGSRGRANKKASTSAAAPVLPSTGIRASPSSSFVSPYTVAEMEFIRDLYKIVIARDLRSRSWSVQTWQESDVLYLYLASEDSVDPAVQKANVGAIMFSQHSVVNDNHGEVFLVNIKPRAPAVGTELITKFMCNYCRLQAL